MTETFHIFNRDVWGHLDGSSYIATMKNSCKMRKPRFKSLQLTLRLDTDSREVHWKRGENIKITEKNNKRCVNELKSPKL